MTSGTFPGQILLTWLSVSFHALLTQPRVQLVSIRDKSSTTAFIFKRNILLNDFRTYHFNNFICGVDKRVAMLFG